MDIKKTLNNKIAKKEYTEFLQLCGKRDRNIFTGKVNARFVDYIRLLAIICSFGFLFLEYEVCKDALRVYGERYEYYENLNMDIDEEVSRVDEWLKEFYSQASEAQKVKIRSRLEKIGCTVLENLEY